MPETSQTPVTRNANGSTAAIAVVLLLAGLLFSANIKISQDTGERHPQDIMGLAQQELARVEELTAQEADLQSQVDDLVRDYLPGIDTGDPHISQTVAVAAGFEALSGPGIEVRLQDAPAGDYGTEFVPDDLVVHQQDVEAVVNSLWSGGAEAMSLQGQRVIATTAFRCVGNVLLLHGRVWSPPYSVIALGDPVALEAALYANPQVQAYLRYVELVGLGWQVIRHDEVSVPAYQGSFPLRLADVPEGTEVFPR